MKKLMLLKDYVWCDVHGEVHPRERDYYDEKEENCRPMYWRKIWTEKDKQ